jgi:hypothetical protein
LCLKSVQVKSKLESVGGDGAGIAIADGVCAKVLKDAKAIAIAQNAAPVFVWNIWKLLAVVERIEPTDPTSTPGDNSRLDERRGPHTAKRCNTILAKGELPARSAAIRPYK